MYLLTSQTKPVGVYTTILGALKHLDITNLKVHKHSVSIWTKTGFYTLKEYQVENKPGVPVFVSYKHTVSNGLVVHKVHTNQFDFWDDWLAVDKPPII